MWVITWRQTREHASGAVTLHMLNTFTLLRCERRDADWKGASLWCSYCCYCHGKGGDDDEEAHHQRKVHRRESLKWTIKKKKLKTSMSMSMFFSLVTVVHCLLRLTNQKVNESSSEWEWQVKGCHTHCSTGLWVECHSWSKAFQHFSTTNLWQSTCHRLPLITLVAAVQPATPNATRYAWQNIWLAGLLSLSKYSHSCQNKQWRLN